MGQKSHPFGMRLKINTTWKSQWFADTHYGSYVIEDIKIRNFIFRRTFGSKGISGLEISDVLIRRYPGTVDVFIYATRPGLLIGRRGSYIEELRTEMKKKIGLQSTLHINVNEVKHMDLDAAVLAQMVAKMIEGRRPYKRAMKQAVSRAMAAGAKGIKVLVAGRLGGSDMARRESYKEGSVPLHTFDSLINYSHHDALVTYGIIGISVWVYTGRRSKRELVGDDSHIRLVKGS